MRSRSRLTRGLAATGPCFCKLASLSLACLPSLRVARSGSASKHAANASSTARGWWAVIKMHLKLPDDEMARIYHQLFIDKIPVTKVAIEHGVSDRAVRRWRQCWEKYGVPWIVTGKKKGRPPKPRPDGEVSTATRCAILFRQPFQYCMYGLGLGRGADAGSSRMCLDRLRRRSRSIPGVASRLGGRGRSILSWATAR